MQLGVIGLGRMGANIVGRLMRGGHDCFVFDRSAAALQSLVQEHAVGAASLAEFIGRLTGPRAIWLTVPAAAVDDSIAEPPQLLEPGNTLIDGGNSHCIDAIRRAQALVGRQVH